jgi:hypothetical protein
MTKFKPILFSTPMVQAILDGRKTQTRRIIKPLLGATGVKDVYRRPDGLFIGTHLPVGQGVGITHPFASKYQIGDILWVRETWNYSGGEANGKYVFRATTLDGSDYLWKPSIFMPRAAARIFLEVTDVRAERLKSISWEDAIAEGCSIHDVDPMNPQAFIYKYPGAKEATFSPIHSFESLWQSINGPESWDANPWVWVYEFKRVEKPSDF